MAGDSRLFSSSIAGHQPGALGAMQCTRNGDYIIDLQAGREARGFPAVSPAAMADSRKIVSDEGGYWINLSPLNTTTIGNLVVSGTTNLPPDTNLSVNLYSTAFHPGGMSSHEHAAGHGKVFRSSCLTLFYGSVNTSLLYPGEYILDVDTIDSEEEAYASGIIDLIPKIPTTPGRMNYIDWSRLAIPTLVVNDSIKPEINSWWKIVEKEKINRGDVTYGTVIYCAWDGICRVFDHNGTQYFTAYDGMSITEVPNNSSVSCCDNNVTLISLNDQIILTKIHEHVWDWEE